MLKILDVYIGRTIIATTSLVLGTLVGLSAIIKYVDQLRGVGIGSYDFVTALQFVLLSMPRDIELFFPMAVLLGALIGLGALASSSELVVMQAAGYSKMNIGVSVLKTAIPLMFLVTLLGQWGAPEAQKAARELRTFAQYSGRVMSVQQGVWAKDGKDFIYMAKAEQQKTLKGVNIWRFDDEQSLKQQIFAERGDFDSDNSWHLYKVTITNFAGEKEISKQQIPMYKWQTTLTPEKLSVVEVKPEEMSLSGIYDFVSYLKDSEQDASRYELALWRKLLQPFTIAIMMLMALSFVFGPLRSVTMGARVLSGVLFGFGFYIANEVFGPMIMVYQMPPVIGAAAPSLVFLLVTVYLLNRKL
ncbi:LPS export ABC transporter permease LptG [Veronia pacifica]|uniref:Lipopolysaccharide ABC transporter permease LptG n=1 Tax=Veronia pacifica TaxID=1080227 RepID=A0A1C3EQA1_9GAMM|nr:LPS export ABC transporter permease LptG [Veronia pacifica]ODA35405.1 lipopolysaccharide ABC transporter permease LptG [Veronia pacifica]